MAKQTAKHSNVYYIYNRESVFEAVEKAKGCKNNHGLDLFRYNGYLYEGRSGIRFIAEVELPKLDSKIESMGGVEKFNERIGDMIKTYGESPRYTRPDERKKDIFPPDPAKENIILAKDVYGKRQRYFRFSHGGYELFTLNKREVEGDTFRQVFVQCEGYMLGIDQHHRLDEIITWLNGLETDVKGEVEKRFNESLTSSNRWADIGYANILGRADEAKAHNAPIREARELESKQRDADREAKRIAEEQAARAEYEQAIKTAENNILNKQNVANTELQGKSLIMQLFREYKISVPLKTQGWIINALHSIEYNVERERWRYRYFTSSRDSTVFSEYLQLLATAVQLKAESGAD
jgi:hypothetical protein